MHASHLHSSISYINLQITYKTFVIYNKGHKYTQTCKYRNCFNAHVFVETQIHQL